MPRSISNFFNGLEQKQTWLHRLNPAIKVSASILLLVMIFLPNSVVILSLLLISTIIMLATARVSWKSVRAILRTCLILFVVVFLITWLVSKSPRAIVNIDANRTIWGWDWNILKNLGWINTSIISGKTMYWYTSTIWGGYVSNIITPWRPMGQYLQLNIEGVTYYLAYHAPIYALSSQVLTTTLTMMIKIFMMLSIFSLQVNTTSTLDLSYGLQTIFKPLSLIKVPTASIATAIAVAIKFVPNLFAEANAIIKAQACRGQDFRNGGLLTKVKVINSLIVPMFSLTFNKADKLADAMEARNFNPRIKPTRYRTYPVNWVTWLGFIILVLLFTLLIVMTAKKVIIGPLALIDLQLI